MEKKRLRPRQWRSRATPVFTARNIRCEMADRDRALGHGGIGAMRLLARKVGLIDTIDRQVRLLKVHLPYHESDHVLNIAYKNTTHPCQQHGSPHPQPYLLAGNHTFFSSGCIAHFLSA